MFVGRGIDTGATGQGLRVEQIRSQRERAEEIAVWDCCKRAEYQIDLETPESYRQSVSLFDRALELDGRSPRAWAGRCPRR